MLGLIASACGAAGDDAKRDGPVAEGRSDGAPADARAKDGSVDGPAMDGARDGVLTDAAAVDTGSRDASIVPPGVSTLAGDAEPGFVDGPATTARFDNPVNVAVGPDGLVYVADRE